MVFRGKLPLSRSCSSTLSSASFSANSFMPGAIADKILFTSLFFCIFNHIHASLPSHFLEMGLCGLDNDGGRVSGGMT